MKQNNKKANKLFIGMGVGTAILVAVLIIGSIVQGAGGNRGSRQLPFITIEDTIEILNDRSGEGFFLYVGRPTCPACVIFEPVFEQILRREYRSSIPYFNLDSLRLEEAQSEEELEFSVEEIVEMLNVYVTPTLVFIRDGEVVDLVDQGLVTQGGVNEELVRYFIDRNGGLD